MLNKFFPAMFFLLILGFFLPRITVSGLWIGIDDLLPLLSIPLFFFFYMFRKGFSGTSYILVLPLLLFVAIFGLYGVVQGVEYLNVVKLPTELWQYLKRAICFLIATITFYHLPAKKQLIAIKILLLSGFLFLLIGILQLMHVDLLVSIYGRTEQQISTGLYNDIHQRIYSVSGFSTSWGGMTIFIFYASIALISISSFLQDCQGKIKKSSIFMMFVFFVLCLINIVASGSRGAMIAFVISFSLFLFLLSLRMGAKNIFIFPLVFLVLLVVGYIGLTLFDEKISFILFRFGALTESSGGGRDQQILKGLALLGSWYEWIMGVSNGVQRTLGQSWGIESEPFNILVNYGAFGFGLIYSTLIIILIKLRRLFYKRKSRTLPGSLVYISMICGIAGYMLFSLGYFYFAELIVGVYSWLIFGAIIGVGQSIQEKSNNAVIVNPNKHVNEVDSMVC